MKKKHDAFLLTPWTPMHSNGWLPSLKGAGAVALKCDKTLCFSHFRKAPRFLHQKVPFEIERQLCGVIWALSQRCDENWALIQRCRQRCRQPETPIYGKYAAQFATAFGPVFWSNFL